MDIWFAHIIAHNSKALHLNYRGAVAGCCQVMCVSYFLQFPTNIVKFLYIQIVDNKKPLPTNVDNGRYICKDTIIPRLVSDAERR